MFSRQARNQGMGNPGNFPSKFSKSCLVVRRTTSYNRFALPQKYVTLSAVNPHMDPFNQWFLGYCFLLT